MSKDWAQDVTQAVQEIAAAADSAAAPRPVTEEFGEVFISLGKAAGHADRLASSGSAGRTAREHFRRHMLDLGLMVVLMLRRGYEQQGGPTPTELTSELARRRLIPGQQAESKVVEPPPGHAAGALGAAIVALGRAVTIQLDADNPRGLDDAMESVLAAAIAAVALAPRELP